MKICVISTSVFKAPPEGYSGLEMIAWQCAKGLAELGHEVSLVAPFGSSCPGVSMINAGAEGTWEERQSYNLYWKELLRFDVVIDHTWTKNSYMLKAEGVLKCPILGVMHAPIATMYGMLPPVDNPCMVCISHDQANHFQALHNREAKVCYNGVDHSVYRPLGIPRTDRFLFCGRIASIKGTLICMKACKEAGVGLDVIGDTKITNEPDYHAACVKEADGKQIRLIGNQTRGSCVWWMSQAHAFIHSAFPFREPYGLAPVEAMLCGLPVIASDNGALRETVPHGPESFAADAPGVLLKKEKDLVEAIRAWKERPFRPEQRANVRELAKRFSVQAMCRRYEELAKEALEGGW